MDAYTKYPDHSITEASWPCCVGIAFNIREDLRLAQEENARLRSSIEAVSTRLDQLSKKLERLEESMGNSDSE